MVPMERLEPFPVLAGSGERDEDPGGGGDDLRRHLGLVKRTVYLHIAALEVDVLFCRRQGGRWA
jgi:hypothetical protein